MSVHFTFQVGQGDSHTGVRPVMGKVLQATEALHPFQAACYRVSSPTRFRPRSSNLWRRPPHDRHRADAVLRATLDNPIAIRHVNQHIALAVEEPDYLKLLEHEAAVLVEDALAVLELADDLDRADLTAGDAGVTRVLRHPQFALHPSRLRTGDVTGDALNFGVVEAVDHDLVVGPEQAKMRADRAGRAAFGATEDPPSEEHNNQENTPAENNSDPFHYSLPSWSEFAPHLAAIEGMRQKQQIMPTFCLCDLPTLGLESLLMRNHPFPCNRTLPPDTKSRKRTYDPEDTQ